MYAGFKGERKEKKRRKKSCQLRCKSAITIKYTGQWRLIAKGGERKHGE